MSSFWELVVQLYALVLFLFLLARTNYIVCLSQMEVAVEVEKGKDNAKLNLVSHFQ